MHHTGMRTPANALLYALRVGKKPLYSSVKANFQRLVVLLRPKAFINNGIHSIDALCIHVLRLSEGVELNSAPGNSDVQALLDEQANIREAIGEMIKKLEDYITQTDMHLHFIESELEPLARYIGHVGKYERIIEDVSAAMQGERIQLTDLDRRSRRNNIVIIGLKVKK